MSSFASKRKARKITVQDDDETPSVESLNPPPEPQEPALQPTFKTRKPLKQSSLRKSINYSDEASKEEPKTSNSTDDTEDQDDGGAPVRIRSSTARPGLAKSKKRQSSSRLSFGPSELAAGGDDDAMVLGEDSFTPKKPGPATSATENSTYKKGISKHLPLDRFPVRSMDDDDDRPRYSKEYLSELQSATPNTPHDISKLHITSEEDEMSLDPSELEGAMIVDTTPSTSTSTALATGGSLLPTGTTVLTEAEIREKKERRARLAKQKGNRDTEDFISLSDNENDNDARGAGDSYLSVLSRNKTGGSSKNDTRLVREDEDLGEGFDEFVEDGGLSLGRKAERAARKRHRAEMASLIHAAEGTDPDLNNTNDGDVGGVVSDDSEAERHAAFEAAQTRAGMDGLAAEKLKQQQQRQGREGVVPVPPRITPLPDLSVLVDAFKARMREKEANLSRMRAHIAALRKEREDVLKREPEVQRLLNEAGERYRALMMPGGGATGVGGSGSGTGGENTQTNGAEREGSYGNENGSEDGNGGLGSGRMGDAAMAARTLLGHFGDGPGTPGERGLESLGTTPVRQAQMEL
ncbi:nineteen complex-related protein 2-domain-containing protein [Nemania sp. FL0916]|nr:nineteen complex-related protein 2-domain-containing protein [Nemania sp. FL0916]